MWYFKIGISLTVVLFIVFKLVLYRNRPVPKGQFVGLLSLVLVWPILILYILFPKKKQKDEDSGTD